MDDLISRQSVIDKLKREEKIFYSPAGLKYLIGAVRDLPSVQPETHDKRTGTYACDLISKQAAIDAVKKNTFRLTFAEEQDCEGHVAWSAEAVYRDVMEGALQGSLWFGRRQKTWRFLTMCPKGA